MKTHILLIAFTALAFVSCKKEKKTEEAIVVPTVSTTSITNISYNSAQTGGSISSDGGAQIMEKGVVYSTSSNPVVNGVNCYSTQDGSGQSSFSSVLINLVPNTTYYVRAWAKNQSGYGYGNQVSFVTLSPALASLTTDVVTFISSDSGISGGNITSDGGSAISARGICYALTSNPTLADFVITDGSGGTGTYVSSMTGLTSSTTYYVRSYATNSTGTAYGNEVSFTTGIGVGDSYKVGIIAYMLQFGDPGYDMNVPHGLIAAPSDQSTGAPWAPTLSMVGSTSMNLGTGASNTNLIASNFGVGTYAAKLCDDLVLGGYSDWYLPSLNELGKLYLNRTAIGGFSLAFYWSSSEDNTNSAWVQSFNSASQSSATKTTNYNVRAIRSF